MSVSSKIKALMNLTNTKNPTIAESLNMSAQAFSTKLFRGSFSAEDLIKIASCLDCELVFIINDKQKVVLDETDLRKSEV